MALLSIAFEHLFRFRHFLLPPLPPTHVPCGGLYLTLTCIGWCFAIRCRALLDLILISSSISHHHHLLLSHHHHHLLLLLGRRGSCSASICSQFDNERLGLTAARCSIPRDGDESCKLACTFDGSDPAGCLPLDGFIRESQARGYSTRKLEWVRLDRCPDPPPPVHLASQPPSRIASPYAVERFKPSITSITRFARSLCTAIP